jgi:threonine dehydratase
LSSLALTDVERAAERIARRVRTASLIEAGRQLSDVARCHLVLEFLQHTGSFKPRGAANFLLAHNATGSLPSAGITIASGGNAGLACAWAAAQNDVRATIFVPETVPEPKLIRLQEYGAEIRKAGREYAEAAAACDEFALQSGALRSHAYDDALVAAGAGTVMLEIYEALGGQLDTVVVAVGGGGLLAGIGTVARALGVRVVAVEPEGCCAFHAARVAGRPVDVAVDSIAADALGARRVTSLALAVASDEVRSALVDDAAIIAARNFLWSTYRLAVEHGAAAAVAALLSGAYEPEPEERIAIVLCGANTDPSSLINPKQEQGAV